MSAVRTAITVQMVKKRLMTRLVIRMSPGRMNTMDPSPQRRRSGRSAITERSGSHWIARFTLPWNSVMASCVTKICSVSVLNW